MLNNIVTLLICTGQKYRLQMKTATLANLFRLQMTAKKKDTFLQSENLSIASKEI